MFKRFIPFNLALLIILILIARHISLVWYTPIIKIEPSKITTAEKPVPPPSLPQPSPPPSYQVIIDKDIFRPSRTRPQEVVLKPPPPRFTVSGIFLVGDKKRALIGIEEPRRPPAPQKTGDVIEGFKIVEILKNKVVMERDDKRIEVFLKTPMIIPLNSPPPRTAAKGISIKRKAVEEPPEPPPPPEPPRPPGAPPIKIIQAPPP